MTRQQLIDVLLAQERTTDMVLVYNLWIERRKQVADPGGASNLIQCRGVDSHLMPQPDRRRS